MPPPSVVGPASARRGRGSGAGKPATVLFLHRGGGQIRGSENTLLSLLEGLDRAELRPVVICSHPVLLPALTAIDVTGVQMEFPEVMLTPRELRLPLLRYARALRELRRICRAERVRLMVCNGGGPCQLGVPAAASAGVPSMCIFHHPAPRLYYREWLMGFVGTLVFNSEFTADHVRAHLGRSGAVIPPGVDVQHEFTPARPRDPGLRRELGIAPGDVVFAQVGALVPHKEHAVLVEAFARASRRLPGARLLVIGAGPEAGRLHALVERLGLSARVTWTGYVDDVTPFLRHVVDVNVLASREEGLGLVNLQASACGLPNLGADGTGIRETIIHGRTGYLFPVGDADALAACMVHLGQDEVLRAALGREGRAFVVERFSEAVYRARLQELMRERVRGGAA